MVDSHVEEAVEAAARALSDDFERKVQEGGGFTPRSWDEVPPVLQKAYRKSARAVLEKSARARVALRGSQGQEGQD